MHHKNEVAKIMNDLVKGQGLDIGPEIKRVHELMDDYKLRGSMDEGPVTAQILEGMGFEKTYEKMYFIGYSLYVNGFEIEYEFRKGNNTPNSCAIECVSLECSKVHQLRLLIKALSGE